MKLALVLCLLSTPAWGHDLWINWGGYTSPTGEHCCGAGDCSALDDADVKEVSSGYRISSLKETVPFSEVQQSQDRHYWRCKRWDGSRRCFFAPGPGS